MLQNADHFRIKLVSKSTFMIPHRTNSRELGYKAYFDTPYLPLYQALESALMILQAAGLDPDRYMIETGDSSRSLIRQSGQIYSREEVLEEIQKDNATTFFVHPIRDDKEQVIHISPLFHVAPFRALS